jgi:hypothetical protein
MTPEDDVNDFRLTFSTANGAAGSLYPGENLYAATPQVGINKYLFPDDYDGNPRQPTGNWDMGAFVYTGAVQTCQNQGYQCCPSCQSGPHPEYNGDCPGEVCCEKCNFLPEQFIEAEDGDLISPMQPAANSSASEGYYISTNTFGQGNASFTFDIQQPGRYWMQAMVLAPSGGRNSFYIGLDGEPVQGDDNYTYDTLLTDVFAWDNVSLRGPSGTFEYAEFDPMVWDLSLGLHTFTFYGRETNTWLDQITLKRQPDSPKTYPIVKVYPPPVIDGDLSDFSPADVITLSNSRGTIGNYMLLWDDNALYIAAQVSDTQLNAIGEQDGSLWNDDSIELFFDTLHDDGPSRLQDDYKFFVNVNNIHRDERASDGNWNITYSSEVSLSGTLNNNADSDTGYTIEAAIPWSNWGVTPPSPGSMWGFDLVMNDRNASGTRIWTAWANQDGDNNLNNPDGWGDLLFIHRSDINLDGCIDLSELLAFVKRWKISSKDVPMPEVMEAISLWKSGQGCS